ncbi:MAG: FAD-dependent oxidoreductase [Anaerolineaceae bacterium]|nr:FAD-dependent oxidoreductase [Anaerolineaceae bacterium]
MPIPQKIPCKVERIANHGQHVYTVTLIPDRILPRFLPGQFLHLAIDPYDPGGFWPESRVFSIASSPANRNELKITYSVRGKFTSRMENELQVGSEVWVKMPYGEFIIPDTTDVALFAGGTGVTAFTAFIDGLTLEFQHSVALFYGAQTPQLLLYRGLVEEKARQLKTVTPYFFFEQGQAQECSEHTGRLSVEFALRTLQNPKSTDFYLSGPPPMLRGFSHNLEMHGIHQERIHQDAWE